jgi:hypothetical protein
MSWKYIKLWSNGQQQRRVIVEVEMVLFLLYAMYVPMYMVSKENNVGLTIQNFLLLWHSFEVPVKLLLS